MATVLEVMAKLSGNSSGMVAAFKQATTAAKDYSDRTRAATQNAIGTPDINGRLRDARGKFISQADQVGRDGGKKLGDSLTSTAGAGFNSGFKGIMAGAAALAATVGFGALIKEAGAASDATDKFKSTMNFAGLNTSAIDAATASAKAYADSTVYELSDIQKTMATLAANGVKNYTGIAEAAGNLNAVAGGNAETFKSVSLALGQSAGAGKLMAEDWNMLADAIPGASGQLQNAMREAGAFEGNFKKAMENGEITAEEFQAAITKLGSTPIASEAARSTKTFEGALGNLNATINSGLMGALNAVKPAATGAISGLASGLGSIFTAFGAIYTLFKTGDFTGAIGKALGVEEDSKVIDVLFTIREAVAGFFDGLTTGSSAAGGAVRGVMDAVAPAFAQLAPAFAAVLPSLMTLVQSFSPLSIAFQALLPVLPMLAGAAATLAASLGAALAGALQVLAPLVAGIITGVSQAVTWFMGLQGGAEALSAGIIALVAGLAIYKGVIFAISAATKAWAAVQLVMNAIMAINPVTLIIIGIAALIAAIVLLVMNWDNVVKFITQIWGGFVNWITGVMDGFVGWLAGIWAAIVAGVTSFATGLFTPIVDAWNVVLGFFATVGAIIVGYVTGIVNDVVAGWSAMVAFITGIFTGIGSFITGVWTWIFNLLTSIGAAFWAEHGAQLTAAWNFIVSIFTAILGFIVGVWTAVGTAVNAAWTWIVGIISGALTAAWGVIVAVFTTVLTFIISVWTTVGGAVNAAWAWIIGIIGGALAAVWGVISSVFNTVAGFIAGVWNGITGAIRGAVAVVSGVISGWVNAAWSVISSTFSRVVGFLGGIWGNIISGVTGMVGRIGSAFSGIMGAVTGALSGAGTWLLEAGKNIVQGLINGVQSLAGTIGSAFLSMVPGWIVGPFKAALGIASPSKLFTQFGKWIVEGLANGVHAKGPAAVKAVRSVAEKLTKAAEGHFNKYRAIMARGGNMGDARAEYAMGANLSRAAAQVNAQVRRVGQLANQKTALAARLKAAQKKLTDAVTVRNKKAAEVTGNLNKEFDLGSLVGYSAKDVAVQTKLIGDRIRNFGTKIAALKKAGLSAALVDQVADLGSVDGTIMADNLLKGGAKPIADLNKAYLGIGASAKATGNAVADGMFKAGIDSVRGLVGGITKNIRAVDQAASLIASRLTAQVRRTLGIKSPSRVFMAIGDFVLKGLGRGIKDATGGAVKDMDRAVAAVTTAATFAPPVISLPKVPDIAAQLALPDLVQTVRLNFVGTSPVEAMAALAREVRAQGPDGYLQGLDGGGYSAAALGARGAAQGQQAPVVHVNVTAVVTNPFTGEEVQARVTDVAVDVVDKALTGTARAAKAKRGSAMGGW